MFYKGTMIFNTFLLLPIVVFSQTNKILEHSPKKVRIEIKLTAGVNYLSIGDWFF